MPQKALQMVKDGGLYASSLLEWFFTVKAA
jgi:hypothetical protein